MDVVKICEVVNGCEDCPKYGDDCDGDKMTEHTDLISRADAIGAVHEYYQKRFTEDSKWDADAKMFVLEDKTIAKDNMEICNIIKALPSADTVSREFYNDAVKANIRLVIENGKLKEQIESADAAQLKQTDTLIIADALRYLAQDNERHLSDRTRADALREQILQYGASMCHSADAEQVTSKLKNPCDSLLTDDSVECKEQKSKLESANAVQGEWEHWGSPFSDESEVMDTIVCSVCGARFIEPKDEPKGEYNFCPNCGARMKGGGE